MRKPKPLPAIETLRKLIDYDPDTGILTWKPREGRATWNTRFAGKQAIAATVSFGYLRGAINGQQYLAHRIAYAIYHGTDPALELDHINGVRNDNRISNLRLSDPTINNRNMPIPSHNTSGIIGVTQSKNGRWRAFITLNNKYVHLGRFATCEEAVAARKAAEMANGFHANHGRPLPLGAVA